MGDDAGMLWLNTEYCVSSMDITDLPQTIGFLQLY